MKKLITGLLLLQTLSATAQKKYSISALANFDVAAKGFGLNDAGIGFTVAANAFAQKNLQLKIEAGLDHFIGDKLLALDANGNALDRNPTVWSLKAGPEFFMADKVSVSGLLGLGRYRWEAGTFTPALLKLALTAYAGKTRRGLFSLSYSLLSQKGVRFLGLHAGLRFL